jgi:hypothetical protein
MAKTFTVKAKFVADDKASPQIAKVESRFKKLTSTVKSSGLAQIAAFGGVAVALRGLIRFMGDSIAKANEQEVAVNQLNAALSELGPTAAGVSQRLQEQASALQKITTFGDEAIIKVQTMIASFVKDEDAIKSATAATLDFSTAFGIDLTAAAALVSKSLGSSTNALTRYGIEVTGAVGSTERLSTLIDNVAKVAGGRAAAAVDTFAGATTQLGNAFGDLQEKIAANLTQNEDLITSINELTAALSESGPAVVTWSANTIKATKALFEVIGATSDAAGFVGLLTEKLIEAGSSAERFAISQDAIAATAKRYSITVETLNAALKAGTAAQLAEEAATNKANAALGEAKKKADAAKEALKDLAEEGAEKAAAAMERLGDAIGVVTSLELEKEIEQISADMEIARKNTSLTTDELLNLEAKAGVALANLRARVVSLKDGLGDLKVTTEETTPVVVKLADSFDRGAESAERERQAINRLRDDTEALGVVTQRVINGRLVLFDQLGRRTGSRLIRPPGPVQRGSITGFNIPGGTFTTITEVRVDENGNIIP